MKQAPMVRFIGLEPSEALASAIQEKASKLDRFHPSIMSCQATVELAHKHRQQGRLFSVRLDVSVPGRDLTVSRVENEDAYVAVRDAFDDMKRQLDSQAGRMQDKQREPPPAETDIGSGGAST